MKGYLTIKILTVNIGSVKLLIFLLVIAAIPKISKAQAEEFTEKDLKKIEEAEKLTTKARENQLQANELYMEMAQLEQDTSYIADKKTKKLHDDLEKKAINLDLESAKLMGESNKIKWDIYKVYIDRFWKEYSDFKNDMINAVLLEESGYELLYKAASLRESAKRTKNLQDALKKVTEASELEIIGLEKIDMVYKMYRQWPDIPDYTNTTVKEEEIKDPSNILPETVISDNTNGLSKEDQEFEDLFDENGMLKDPNTDIFNSPTIPKVELDERKIQRFKQYIEEHKDDSLILLSNHISGYDIESIRLFWSLYQEVEYKDANIFDQIPEAFVYAENPGLMEENTLDPAIAIVDEFDGQYEKTGYGTNENEAEIGIVSENLDVGSEYKIIYRVQIAKNKTPLSQGLLYKAYEGNKNIGLINENGWYKYSIGDFETYGAADTFRNSLRIEEAFVVAYRELIHFKEIAKTEENESGAPSPSLIANSRNTESIDEQPKTFAENEGIVFIVQIAASRIQLNKENLEKLYNGPEEIMLRKEEGWNKYQIGHTNSYDEAKKILSTVKVHGAFIAAYDKNVKLKLWGAIRIKREAENQIIFNIQIAASRDRLSDESIRSIYSGNESVNMIREDGMYKYQITGRETYEEAVRLKNLMGIKGSFIVPYRNGNKMDIKNAIELTKNND